jgi:hypothetical protein
LTVVVTCGAVVPLGYECEVVTTSFGTPFTISVRVVVVVIMFDSG